MEKKYDIAIIGAGPAGIATACEAVIMGVEDIILFEKSANHSDTIRKYFKDNKPVDKDWKGIQVELEGHIDFESCTKEDTLDLFDALLEKHLIETQFETEVSSIEKEDGYFTITTNRNETIYAKDVVVSIGKMGKPNKPDYDIPKNLKSVVNFNVNDCHCGSENILVVGGGDSAVEFAYFIYNGNSVTLNYRKPTITRANPKNLNNLMEQVDKGNIDLKLGVDIDSIEDVDGKIKVNFSDGSNEIYDRIIYGLGGSTPKDFFENANIMLDEKGKPIVDKNYLNPTGIYFAGDVAGSLGGSIAAALNHGYHIIKNIKK
jgi:thioredoxin reductase (NADPH)